MKALRPAEGSLVDYRKHAESNTHGPWRWNKRGIVMYHAAASAAGYADERHKG
jgi:hypothetical protein